MSDVPAIGSGGSQGAPIQAAAASSAGQAPAAGQASAAGQADSTQSGLSSTSVQQSQHTMISSVSSQVNMMVAQFGSDMSSEQLIRLMAVLMLLDQLIQQMEGRKDGGEMMLGSLGQQQNASVLLSSSSYSSTQMMSSSSFQMTATEAYESSAALSDQSNGAAAEPAVSPVDTQGGLDGGDAGHQLNVTA